MGLVPLETTALPQPWARAFQICHQVLPCELPPLRHHLFLPVKSQHLPSSYLEEMARMGHLGAEIFTLPLPHHHIPFRQSVSTSLKNQSKI